MLGKDVVVSRKKTDRIVSGPTPPYFAISISSTSMLPLVMVVYLVDVIGCFRVDTYKSLLTFAML